MHVCYLINLKFPNGTSALKEALDLIEIKVVLNSKTQFGKKTPSQKLPLLFDKSISFKKPSIKKS